MHTTQTEKEREAKEERALQKEQKRATKYATVPEVPPPTDV